MSWQHRVDRFTFQFWDGDQPQLPKQNVQTFARAGDDAQDARLTGTRAPLTECTLTAHLVRYSLALPLLRQYFTLIGKDPVEVWHEQRRLLQLAKVKFLIEDVVEVECRTNVRLIGPGYDYPGGCSLVTRWRMLAMAQ